MVNVQKEELEELLHYYQNESVEWGEKGEEATKDVPRLIQYIQQLENRVEGLERYIKSEF